ncbi:MAG: WD40 repeat domain-containing protein [Anaerolineae bacterium]|nr:WD40 repeat domain-containing protein [Anaerolineae bacterium]
MRYINTLHRCLLGLALCLMLLPTPAQALPPRQTADIPYLMAYNDQPAPHFVIERADGMDSRTFGEGLMPEDTNTVSGPGWSPSGQWFAWTANTSYLESNRGSTAYVLSADGQTRPTGLDDMGRINLAWSPNADVLVVAGLLNPPVIVYDDEQGYVTQNDSDTLTMRISLFDPASDTFIVVQDMPAPYERTQLLEVSFRLKWREDGQYAFVQTDAVDENGATFVRFYSLGMEGQVSSRDYDPATLLTEDVSLYRPDVMLTTRGEIASQPRADSVNFDDVVTGLPSLHLQTITERIEKVDWSPDGEYAALLTSKTCDEPDCPKHALWVYSRTENDLILLVRAQSIPFTVFPAPDFSRYVYIESRSDGEYAMFVDLTDADPIELQRIDPDTEYDFVRWTNSTRFVIPLDDHDRGVGLLAAYEVSDNTPVELGQFAARTYDLLPPLAPHRPLALIAWDTVDLLDVTNGEITRLPPDPRRYFTNPYGDARWHPIQDWALLEENAAVAGGGAPIYTGVVNADGTVRRMLGGCIAATSICAHWLPPQVDPTTLAPGHDNTPIEPTARLPVGHWTDEIIWSPDLSQVAVGHDWRSYGETVPFDVWRVTDGTQVEAFETVTPKETIEWVGDQPQVVALTPHPLAVEFGLITVAPDGSQFARYWAEEPPYTVYLELADAQGNILFTLEDVLTSEWHASLNYSPDSRYLAVSSNQSPVRLLDTTTGEVVAELPMLYSGAVAFSPDGTFLAVAYSTEIWIYRVADILNE